MSQQTSQQIAKSTSGTCGKGFKFAAVTAAVIVTMFFTVGTAAAGSTTQNVNVVNAPTVNVGNTPTVNVANTPNVSVANTPSVNVANTPAVSISGTPGVSVANSSSQPVPTFTVGPNLVTHVGQPPSHHFVLVSSFNCPSWTFVDSAGNPYGPFTIPPNNHLVITDMDMSAHGGTPGNASFFNLYLGNSDVLDAAPLADASGVLSTQQHLTGGLVVTVLPTCSAPPAVTVDRVNLRGYIVVN